MDNMASTSVTPASGNDTEAVLSQFGRLLQALLGGSMDGDRRHNATFRSLRDAILNNRVAQTDIMRLMKLRQKEGSLDDFPSIWWYIFFWVLVSSLVAHAGAAMVCLIAMNKQRWAVWAALTLLLAGVMFPITLGACTSAVIAWACLQCAHVLPPLYALAFGVGQTVCHCTVAFSKMLATL